jgi:GH24 family phage-related lysozyme (muramidase)
LGKDSILLGALAYNIGPGAVNKSSVYKMLKSGNRNIFKAYTSHCHNKGKWHKGLYNRRYTEILVLFIP